MKEKFIKSTIILLIGGAITKILGMVNKILLTRYLGPEGIGIYMLVIPSFILFINIASFGLPVAISKFVSEDTKNNKKLISTAILFILFVNLLLMIIIILFSKSISISLLHDRRCYYGILSISLVLPFVSISSILRSYFFGKERMFPHIVSNIFEDIVKILIIVLLLPLLKKQSIEIVIGFIILSNIVSEIASIVIMFLFLPHNFIITKKDIIPSKIYLKDSLSIGIPTTLTRLTGSICYFLEPIILTTVLISAGYSNNFIVSEYGVISGYVIPIILLPSFFSMAISQALLPSISKDFARNNLISVKRKIKKGILYSFFIGLMFTVFIILHPEIPLKTIYHTTRGINYIRFLAPICLLQYIQAPLSSSMDAIGMSKENFTSNLLGVLVRLIFLLLFSLLKIGLWGLIISTSINIVVVTLVNILQIKKRLST